MGFPCTTLDAISGGGATRGARDCARPRLNLFSLTLSFLIVTVTNSPLTGSFPPTNLHNKPLSTGPRTPLCMYDNGYDVDDSNDLPSDEGGSDMAWLGDDDSFPHWSDFEQDSDGVYRPIDESDVEEEAQTMTHRLPSLPPAFRVDPVHLDILELPERLRVRQVAAQQLLSDEDRRDLFPEGGPMNWDHPLAVASLEGDVSAFIQPPDIMRFGAELRAALHMLGTASLWLRSADPSSIPPDAQDLVWNYLLALLNCTEHFPPSNEVGTFNVPPALPAASGSATTGPARQSNSGAMGDASSSKRRRCRRR